MLVAGVDSSTQSTKVLLCQAADGTIVARGSAPHPPGTECDPAAWWSALEQAGQGLLGRADAIAVAAQQHGMVVVDEAGDVAVAPVLPQERDGVPQDEVGLDGPVERGVGHVEADDVGAGRYQLAEHLVALGRGA